MVTIRQVKEAENLEFAKEYLSQNCIDSTIIFERIPGGDQYASLQVEDSNCEEALRLLKDVDAWLEAKPKEKVKNDSEMSEEERQQLLRKVEEINKQQMKWGIMRAVGIILRMIFR